LFAYLKRKVDERLPRTQEELRTAIREEFNAIPQAMVDRYVRSYPKRLQECIRMGGETIQTKIREQSGFE